MAFSGVRLLKLRITREASSLFRARGENRHAHGKIVRIIVFQAFFSVDSLPVEIPGCKFEKEGPVGDLSYARRCAAGKAISPSDNPSSVYTGPRMNASQEHAPCIHPLALPPKGNPALMNTGRGAQSAISSCASTGKDHSPSVARHI